MSNVKTTRSNLILTKPKDALHKASLLPQKMYFNKNIVILPHTKKYLNIAPSKNVFQNCCKLNFENKNIRYVNYSIFKM